MNFILSTWRRTATASLDKKSQGSPFLHLLLYLIFIVAYFSIAFSGLYVVCDSPSPHGENFMAIFTTLSVVIWFSTGTLGIFDTLVYVFTMRVVINDILSMEIIPTLSTSILFCNLCYVLLWISPHSVVKIGIRI